MLPAFILEKKEKNNNSFATINCQYKNGEFENKVHTGFLSCNQWWAALS